MAGPLRYDQIDHIPAHLLDKLPRKISKSFYSALSWNYNFVENFAVFYPNIGIETKRKTLFCSSFSKIAFDVRRSLAD